MSAIYFITTEEATFKKCEADFANTPGLYVLPINSLKDVDGKSNVAFVKGSADIVLETICLAAEVSGKKIWGIGIVLPGGSKMRAPIVINGITIKFYEDISNFRKTYEDLLESRRCLCPNGHGGW